jgi:hypothetical protein
MVNSALLLEGKLDMAGLWKMSRCQRFCLLLNLITMAINKLNTTKVMDAIF